MISCNRTGQRKKADNEDTINETKSSTSEAQVVFTNADDKEAGREVGKSQSTITTSRRQSGCSACSCRSIHRYSEVMEC